MKRKVKITFNIDVEYPDVEETKQLSKDFDRWLKDWVTSKEIAYSVPLLYKKFKNKSSEECLPNGEVDIKIERSKEVIWHKKYTNKYLSPKLKEIFPFVLDW